MIVKYFLLSFFVLSSALAHSQHKLQITIGDLRSSDGLVSIELFDKDENSIKGETALITGDSCVMTIEGLKDGEYAVRCFHDENSDQELETNWIGIPKEGIGFSNDAFGKFGPKDFEEWLFEVKGDTKIRISTKYL